MKAENETTDHNRTIKLTQIPSPDVSSMEITINYVHGDNEQGRIYKAVALDNIVIPAIISALNRGGGN